MVGQATGDNVLLTITLIVIGKYVIVELTIIYCSIYLEYCEKTAPPALVAIALQLPLVQHAVPLHVARGDAIKPVYSAMRISLPFLLCR